jgi:F-type H+/Na+-transporting ATPase subunit alpha
MTQEVLSSTEISSLIRDRIDNINLDAEQRTEGTIVSLKDGIIKVHGLTKVVYGEMLSLPEGGFALALNLERDSVGAVVLGDYTYLQEGQLVQCFRGACWA